MGTLSDSPVGRFSNRVDDQTLGHDQAIGIRKLKLGEYEDPFPGLRFNFWFFRVYCERIFTTETQRGRAATETRNISRKDAKAAKVGEKRRHE